MDLALNQEKALAWQTLGSVLAGGSNGQRQGPEVGQARLEFGRKERMLGDEVEDVAEAGSYGTS